MLNDQCLDSEGAGERSVRVTRWTTIYDIYSFRTSSSTSVQSDWAMTNLRMLAQHNVLYIC
jgi:hypothetical protein